MTDREREIINAMFREGAADIMSALRESFTSAPEAALPAITIENIQRIQREMEQAEARQQQLEADRQAELARQRYGDGVNSPLQYTPEDIEFMRRELERKGLAMRTSLPEVSWRSAYRPLDQRSEAIKRRLAAGPSCARCRQKPRTIEEYRYRICCWRTECCVCGKGSFLSASLGKESAACCDGKLRITIRRRVAV